MNLRNGATVARFIEKEGKKNGSVSKSRKTKVVQKAKENAYECELCDAVCDTHNQLRKHMSELHPIRKADVRRHMLQMHVNGVQCTVNGCTATVAKNRLITHIKTAHSDMFPANRRSSKSKSSSPANVPVASQTLLLPVVASQFPCHQCSFVAADSEEITEHIKRVHQKGVDCPVEGCSMTVPLSELETHLNEQHQGQIGLQNEDRETVSSRTNEASSEDVDSDASDWRDKELLDEIETEQRPIDQYNRDTLSVPSLEFIEANDGSFGCRRCQKFYATVQLLRRHNKRVHERVWTESKKREKKHICTWKECDKSFKTQGLLDDHMNWHKGLTPYECKKCKQSFFARAQFAVHLSKYHQSSIKQYSQMLNIRPTK
ncbi:hypothetical protein WR25_14915 [Diploscapter pachys]|uniref:C2H2-type domain-containing protein n=1 Tax=Diploscapter pachys TaxID=2018661 RepID=A0A2A2J2N5_9BILA|nr:hypothetical protein WR25_14915 [Diploscapter pachys]